MPRFILTKGFILTKSIQQIIHIRDINLFRYAHTYKQVHSGHSRLKYSLTLLD